MQTVVTKYNVELASRHSHSILKINTTILCWLPVDNDAEEIYIYIYIDARKFTRFGGLSQ